MHAPGGSDLARGLLEQKDDPLTWGRFGALGPDEKEQVVDALKAEVDRCVRTSPPDALGASEVLARAAQGVPAKRVLALRGRAAALHVNGDAAGALASYLEAEQLSREAGDALETARIQRSLIDVHQMAGQAQEALACAGKARAVFEAEGERRMLAQLEVNVGNVHFRRDDHGAAREHYTRARDLFRAVGDAAGLPFAEYNLANLETNANRFEDAESSYRSAREGFERAGMSALEADCDYALAYLESRRGRFAAALQGLDRARKAYAAGGKPSGVPLCDLDLAEIYLRLDARRDALEHAQRARTAFAELGLLYEGARSDILAGVARLRLGDRQQALDDLTRAAEAIEALGNETLRAFLTIQTATIRAADSSAALRDLRRAHRTLAGGEHRFLAELSTVALAHALSTRGEAREALEVLASLRTDDADASPLDALLAAEVQRLEADAHVAIGDPEAAVSALERAVAAIEDTYAEVPGRDARIAFFRDRHEVFVDLAWLLLQRPDASDKAALALLERSRARSAAVVPSPSAAGAGSDEGWRSARERVDLLLNLRLEAELGSLDPRGGRSPSDDDLRQAERELAARTNASATGTVPAPSFEVDEAMQVVRGDEVLLAYMLSRRGACVFAVDRQGLEVVPLEVDASRLETARDHLGLQLQKARLGAEYLDRHEERLRTASERLQAEFGRLLLDPVRRIAANRPVVVVPYGPLHGLPFHAFHLGSAPLVESCEVSYAPSLRALARCRQARPESKLSVLGSGTEETTLPAVAGEMAHLERSFGEAFERVAPQELVAILEAGEERCGILHVAGHGSFHANRPGLSGVRLGERFLTALDIGRLQLAWDLVVLSGCETGRYAHIAGEELFGLDQAFLGAGARSVLGSLWVVADRDSALFMRAFYDRLVQGSSARRAVAEAQRELLAERPLLCSWAAFALTGSPTTASLGD